MNDLIHVLYCTDPYLEYLLLTFITIVYYNYVILWSSM